MELTSEMQRMPIPHQSKVPNEPGKIYKPHYGVGGDYFDFIESDDGKDRFALGTFPERRRRCLVDTNFHTAQLLYTLINKRTVLDTFIRDLNTSVNLLPRGECAHFLHCRIRCRTAAFGTCQRWHNLSWVLVKRRRAAPAQQAVTHPGSFSLNCPGSRGRLKCAAGRR